MTNEEKAKEIAFESPQCQMYIDNKCTQNFPCDRFKVALKMAQWKDEQFEEEKQKLIDKAVEYISIHTLKTMSSRDIHNIIVDFKQVMEGE